MAWARWCVAAVAIAGCCWTALAEPADPAQAIAQKFSEASEPKAAPSATSAATVPAKTTATPAPPAAEAKPASAAPATRPDLDYEMDMLRRARSEADELKSQPPRSSGSAAPLKAVEPAPQPAQLSAPAQAPHVTAAPPLEPAAVPPQPATAAPVAATPAAAQPTSPAPAATVEGAKATILLVLDSRRGSGQAAPDPIICILDICYVSTGLKTAAVAVARRDALTLKGSGERARDSCRGMYGCVFRGVAVPKDALISVIDLSTSGGGDTSTYSIAADPTCATKDGELTCGNALVTHAMRLWVVPEASAETAGAQMLEDAVADGLFSESVASSKDK